MNWLTSFSFLLTLFLSLQIPADSRGFGAASKSPWANAKKANDFMSCLIQNIARSPVFPQQEKEDLESIVETMSSAISSMSTQQRGNTQAQLQAMNMAFASSMAELVIAEDAGNEQAIALKTNALSQALKVCFKSVMGSVNRQFIAEIKDLIQMFAKEAASGSEDNDVDDQSDFSSSDNTQTSYNVASTNLITIDSGVPGGDYPGGQSGFGSPSFGPYGDTSSYGPGSGTPGSGSFGSQGPAGDTSGIANVIAQALGSSQTLQAIVRSGASSGVVGQIISSALQSTLSSSLGVSSNVSGSIISSVQSTISRMGGRIDLASLSSSLSSLLVSGLASSGLINGGNASSVGVALVSGLIQTASRIAPQFGVRISTDVSSDIRSVTNLVQTSMSSVSTSMTTSTTSQISMDLGGPGGPGGYPGGPSDFGSPDLGTNTGLSGPGGPGGQGPAGDTSGIANVIAQSLASSQTLQAIVRSGASSGVVGQIISSALQSTLSSSLGVSSNVSGSIISSVQSTISRMGGRIDLSSLSSSLSSVLVSGLASSGLINGDNASSVGVALVSGLIQNVSRIAPQLGVRISSDVSADIKSITNLVQTSMASIRTSLSSSTTGLTINVGGPGGPSDLQPSVSGGVSAPNLGSLLSSPNGLSSPRATARIQALASNLAESIRKNGVDVNGIGQSLAALSSDAQNSGLSPAEAKVEALLETVVALLNILSSARIGSLNASAVSSVSSNVAASLASVLA